MIPVEAVEAAAKVLDPQTMSSGGVLAEKFKAQTREEARRILEAAAPHMQADFKCKRAANMDVVDEHIYPNAKQYRRKATDD